MKHFIYSLDESTGGGDELNENEKNPNNHEGSESDDASTVKGDIPNANIELAHLAVKVAGVWKQESFFVLKWITQADFEKEAKAFLDHVQQRNSAGGTVSPFVDTLESIDDKIDIGEGFVKSYLRSKYGTPRDKSFYAAFGIVKKGSQHTLPHDREERLEALRLTIEGTSSNGFDAFEYGKDFWTNILVDYEKALVQSGKNKGNVSDAVKTVNVERLRIRQVLQSILLLIKANYPFNNEYKQVRRTWGFQKESN